MGDYERKQIDDVLKDNDEFFRIKIHSGNTQTNHMNISREQLKKIRQIIG